MKLGVCTKFENVPAAAIAGFDYIECNLSKLASLTDGEFAELLESSKSFEIPVLRSNGFIPSSIPVTGPLADRKAICGYLDKAMSRASKLGIEVAVFGSGAARSVPEGWPFAKAWQQIEEFLSDAVVYCEKYGVTLAIEPLRREECNIINYVSEATILASLAYSPYITVLGDSFHMLSGREPYSALTNAGDILGHVHISHPLPGLSKRDFPSTGDGNDEDYKAFFDALKAAGYDGCVSIEAGSKDFEKEAPDAVSCLRRFM